MFFAICLILWFQMFTIEMESFLQKAEIWFKKVGNNAVEKYNSLNIHPYFFLQVIRFYMCTKAKLGESKRKSRQVELHHPNTKRLYVRHEFTVMLFYEPVSNLLDLFQMMAVMRTDFVLNVGEERWNNTSYSFFFFLFLHTSLDLIPLYFSIYLDVFGNACKVGICTVGFT